MLKIIASFILNILGWKLESWLPKNTPKAVIIMAPHTSNWDFYIGKLCFVKMGLNPKILIKQESFVFPIGYILKAMGGLPVDRSKKSNIVERIAKMFCENNEFYVLFTPEATRKKVMEWKKGFYHLAVEAKVPILLGYMDYKKKVGGIGPSFYPTGNIEKDIEEIKQYYKQYSGRHPEMGV